jgi:hypothetical protein
MVSMEETKVFGFAELSAPKMARIDFVSLDSG